MPDIYEGPLRGDVYERNSGYFRAIRHGGCANVIDDTLSVGLSVLLSGNKTSCKIGKKVCDGSCIGRASFHVPGSPTSVIAEGDCSVIQARLPIEVLADVCIEDHDKVLRVEDMPPGLGETQPKITALLVQALKMSAEHDAILRELSTMLLQRTNQARRHGAGLSLKQGGLSSLHLRRIQAFIEAELRNEIKLSTLARLIEMSPYHFMRTFKREVGVSPYQYIIERRVSHAVRDLTSSKNSVESISIRSGFSHSDHLSRHLRQRFGVNARDLRQILSS